MNRPHLIIDYNHHNGYGGRLEPPAWFLFVVFIAWSLAALGWGAVLLNERAMRRRL